MKFHLLGLLFITIDRFHFTGLVPTHAFSSILTPSRVRCRIPKHSYTPDNHSSQLLFHSI